MWVLYKIWSCIKRIMADIKYRIGIGKLNDDITIPSPFGIFTFDRDDITFDSLISTFDETF